MSATAKALQESPAFDPGRLAEPPPLVRWGPPKTTYTPEEAAERLNWQRRVAHDQRHLRALVRMSNEGRGRYWAWRWSRLVREGFTLRDPAATTVGFYECVAGGRCLEPLVPDGARLWFDLDATARDGDIVLCTLDPAMVARMRSDPRIIELNGRPTRGGTYVKRLAWLFNAYYLTTKGSGCVIQDRPECRHHILGVLRHVEIDGVPARGSIARADVTGDNTSADTNSEVDTFTVTGDPDDFFGTVSGDCEFTRTGETVTLRFPNSIVGTSESTFNNWSGIPAPLRPTKSQVLVVHPVIDNGSGYAGRMRIEPDGTFSFLLLQVSGSRVTGDGTFTTSGSKGIGVGLQATYSMS
ncbi:MAG TPA: hypothetical protein VF329_03420 [Gammaproteobacteria bacterium]